MATIETLVKKDLAHWPYPCSTLKGLGLKRSVIPETEMQFVKFTLDNQSNLQFSARALTLGITTDELLRRLVWATISGE